MGVHPLDRGGLRTLSISLLLERRVGRLSMVIVKRLIGVPLDLRSHPVPRHIRVRLDRNSTTMQEVPSATSTRPDVPHDVQHIHAFLEASRRLDVLGVRRHYGIK